VFRLGTRPAVEARERAQESPRYAFNPLRRDAASTISRAAFPEPIMFDVPSFLTAFDDLCRGVGTAIANSELQIYAALALGLTLAFLTFPPRSDPDRL
jgi:hypothetical protein